MVASSVLMWELFLMAVINGPTWVVGQRIPAARPLLVVWCMAATWAFADGDAMQRWVTAGVAWVYSLRMLAGTRSLFLHRVREWKHGESYVVESTVRLVVVLAKVVVLLAVMCGSRVADGVMTYSLLVAGASYLMGGIFEELVAVCLTHPLLLNVYSPPTYNSPWLATSLRDFWSRRWNGLSQEMLSQLVYSRTGPSPFPTFLISGLLHDWWVGVAFGHWTAWNTAFFLAQAVGLSLGVTGRLATLAFLVATSPLFAIPYRSVRFFDSVRNFSVDGYSMPWLLAGAVASTTAVVISALLLPLRRHGGTLESAIVPRGVRVVALPGLDGTGELLRDFAEAIGGEVIAYPTDRVVDEVEYVKQRIGSNARVVIVGESYSGWVAARVAREVGAVGVLVNAFRDDQWLDILRMIPMPILTAAFSTLRKVQQCVPRRLVHTVAHHVFLGHTKWPGSTTGAAIVRNVNRVDPHVLASRVKKLRGATGTVHLHGECDYLVPSKGAHVVLPDGPHMLLQSHPGEAARAIVHALQLTQCDAPPE
eukprot:Sspe_Gene.55531::Locus_30537_Transcript_1_1_Confidence_1.000_Length_2561::g.55531::m.55531